MCEYKHRIQNILSGQSFEGTMPDSEKQIRRIEAEALVAQLLTTLGYDINNDPNMRDTPRRFVKVLMDEIGRGTYQAAPKITTFENQTGYDGIVFEGNIDVKSLCSHHLAFIKGYCHIAYIPGDTVVGLSKLNRIVDWFARRPQLQEQMTMQIHEYLDKMLVGNKGVAVLIEAQHSCVQMRGVENKDSFTTTCKLSGAFLDNTDRSRDEFYRMIANSK